MVLTVAIIGGGIAGLSAAIALRKLPGVDIQVYERAKEFKELGALIGLAPNGLRTLEKLGVEDVLTDEVGWRSPNGVPMCFKHFKTGDVLSVDYNHDVPDRRHQFARMHRASLQKALLKNLPPNILHTGKKVSIVKTNDDSATVGFEDGTSVTADLVIGADGIKSKVRESFIKNHKLSSSGDAIFRTTFAYDLVADLPGLEQNSTHYQSPTSWFFGTRLGSDQFGVTCSFHVDENDSSSKFADTTWNAPATVDDIRNVFKDFYSPIPSIIDRIPEGTLRRYTNVAGEALSHWTFGNRVTLIGDAAHTHGGAYAAGASLAVDDAYVLYLSLRTILQGGVQDQEKLSAARIGEALALYEATRRPHLERVLKEVHSGRKAQAARFEKIREEGVPESDASFRKRLASKGDPVWLNEHDAEAQFHKVYNNSTSSQASVAEVRPKL
ncbi:unnamed protein product [Clonostachys byssicola]|uniref:FAD-binding domain-containing protein n=1 Tax=Clonostachys byssicola TaxID=160290 RepID=A0A9N9UHL5_9HYPO|nr:unnamed protein product [Clonostachys byssicola]